MSWKQAYTESHSKNFRCSRKSMGESNTVVSAYTLYRHLQQYCFYPFKWPVIPPNTWCENWLVVSGFNATLSARVISWRSATHTCFLVFSHQYYDYFLSKVTDYFSYMLLAEERGENTPERKFASTGSRTHNHQITSPTRSPLSYPAGQGVKI